jgi:hypothetical protein
MIMLANFVASQVFLALAIWAIRHVMTRERNLAARFEGIRDIRLRPLRQETAEREVEWVDEEVRGVDRELNRARDRSHQFDALPESAVSIGWYQFLTALLFEADAGLMLLLNQSAALFGMPDVVLAFLSPLVAAAIIGVMHLVFGEVIEIGAAYRTQTLIRRARIGAVIGTSIVIVTTWVVLSGRSFSDPAWVETAAIGLLVLALVLSVAGAFASLVVTIWKTEEGRDRRLMRLERRRTAFDRHRAMVSALLEDAEREPSNESPDSRSHPSSRSARPTVNGADRTADAMPDQLPGGGTPRPGANGSADEPSPDLAHTTERFHRAGVNGGSAGALMGALLVLAGLGCGTGAAAPAAGTPTEPEPPPVPPVSACELLLDVTTSVDGVARDAFVEQLAAQLPQMAETFDCTVVRFAVFSDRMFPLREIALPVAMRPEPFDPATQQSEVRVGVAAATDRLYPKARGAREEEARRQWDASEGQRYDGERQRRGQAVEAAKQVWLEVARQAVPPAACTALDEVVRSAFPRAAHTLVVTDGKSTCPFTADASAPHPPLPAGRSLTFLLVPPAGRDVARRLADHRARLAHVYPFGRMRSVAELTPTTWVLLRPGIERVDD